MDRPYIYTSQPDYVPSRYNEQTQELALFPKRAEPLKLHAQVEMPEEPGWLALNCADYYGRSVRLLWVQKESLDDLVGVASTASSVHQNLRERIFDADMKVLQNYGHDWLSRGHKQGALRCSKKEHEELPYSLVVSAEEQSVLVGFGEVVGEGCFKIGKELCALNEPRRYVQLFPRDEDCEPTVDHAAAAHMAVRHCDGIARATLLKSDAWPSYKRGLLMPRASSTLAELLEAELPKERRLALLQRISGSLAYLAKRHAYLQDVKPENILIFGEQPKLSDCDSLVRVAGQDAQDLAELPVTTHRHIILGGNCSCGAPELFNRGLVDYSDLDLYYDRKDAYSLGAIITMLWLGISGLPDQAAVCAEQAPPYLARKALFDRHAGDPVMQLARDLLSWQPSARPSLAEAHERLSDLECTSQ